jgi:hypothetical protein
MTEGSSPAPPGPEASPSPGRRPRRPRAPGAYLRLALWQRYVVSLGVAGVLLAVMVVFVARHNTNAPTSTNEAAAVQANRDAEILVSQDQAPRTLRLAPGLTPAAALEKGIRARMAKQIAAGAIDGPLTHVRCRPTRSGAGSRHAFSCTVVAGSVSYPFLGVVNTAARRVTYCKRDPPPVASDSVPISRRCRA